MGAYARLMNEFIFVAKSETDTERLGAALAELLPDQTMVALSGTLGAGKTRLVQAVATACGIQPDDVTSPTFVMCQEYFGDRTIYHLDAYRVKDDDEFLELGADEYFEAQAITFVEWAERVVDCIPHDRLEIEIHVTGEAERTFEISATSDRLKSLIQSLHNKLA